LPTPATLDVQRARAMANECGSAVRGALVDPFGVMAAASNVEHAVVMAGQGIAAASGALVEPPGAMAEPPGGLDALAMAVDGTSPTNTSVVALARALLPTVHHPATEYNLPVHDVQRY
jgi:hypothetical protein